LIIIETPVLSGVQSFILFPTILPVISFDSVCDIITVYLHITEWRQWLHPP